MSQNELECEQSNDCQRDDAQYLQNLKSAAEKGSIDALCNLGRIYFEGSNKFAEKNTSTAISYYERAGNLGEQNRDDKETAEKAGFALLRAAEIMNSDMKLDDIADKALSFYGRAAALGNTEASLKIGRYLFKHIDNKALSQKAIDILKNSSDLGSAPAQNEYARYIENVMKDETTALKYYTLSANQGYERAQINASRILMKNKTGDTDDVFPGTEVTPKKDKTKSTVHAIPRPSSTPTLHEEKNQKQMKNSSSELTNDQKIDSIIDRIMSVDAEDHKNRAILMKTLNIPKGTILTPETTKKLTNLLISVFSTAPPFSVIIRSYKQIYFNPRESHEDITIAYSLFPLLSLQTYPNQLLKALARRLTSASNNDRQGAKDCLMKINTQIPYIIHLIALTLTPPPPHGTKDLLDLAFHFLIEYKPPPPLFDDFFVTSSFDDEKNVLGLNSMISEQRLNDGLTIFNELWCTFRILHYGPHYQSYFQQFLKALTALARTNEFFAHDIRRFIVNHWPRLDPQKAVLFMQEATALCAEGPPPEEVVWQNLSWRSSSIHWQIAMEGMKFIENTIKRTEGFDHSILTFLLQDAAKNHWHNGVRTRAQSVLALIPNTKPKRPNLLPFDQWGEIKKIAKKNYPNDEFESKMRLKPK